MTSAGCTAGIAVFFRWGRFPNRYLSAGGPVPMSLSPRRLNSSMLGSVFSHLTLLGSLSTQVVTEREEHVIVLSQRLERFPPGASRTEKEGRKALHKTARISLKDVQIQTKSFLLLSAISQGETSGQRHGREKIMGQPGALLGSLPL